MHEVIKSVCEVLSQSVYCIVFVIHNDAWSDKVKQLIKIGMQSVLQGQGTYPITFRNTALLIRYQRIIRVMQNGIILYLQF